MKHIKTLAVIALFFAVNTISAQTASKSWPKLDDVKQVAARITLNIEQNNPDAFFFTETLKQQTLQLSQSEIPAQYKSKKTQETLKLLNAKTEDLNKKALAKAPQPELKQQFNEILSLLNSLTETKSTK